MKKFVLVLSLIALNLCAAAAARIAEHTLPEFAAQITASRTWPDRSYISILDNQFVQPQAPYGAPMIPYRVVYFAIPDGYAVKGVSAEVAGWETLGEGIRVMPIQPPVPTNTPADEVPEFVELDLSLALNGEAYPASSVERIGEVEENGLNLLSVKATPFRWSALTGKLEQAKNLKIVVTFEEKNETEGLTSCLNFPINYAFQRETRARVVNPKDLPPEPLQMMAIDGTKPLCLFLAPHDLYDDWAWYAGERAKNHPEITFDVVDTDTIYESYPYRNERAPASGPITDLGANENRYPSESIWKWLVNYRQQHSNLTYLVLGGAWFDVTDSSVHYLQDGTEITLKNGIPSMRVKPNRKDGFYNPTDMYYACLSQNANETGHHWDYNDNGIYLEDVIDNSGEAGRTKGWPDIAVSRMSMKPITMPDGVEFNSEFELVGGNRVLDQHQLIRNFLYKVNRAEGKGIVGKRIENDKEVFEYAENSNAPFTGDYKLGITSSYLESPTCYMNNKKVLRDETEFFDRVPNMYDPEHPAAWRDTGPHMRRHVSEAAATRRPVIDAVCYHQGEIYSKNTTPETFSQVFRNFDREIGAVNGHGWAGGTGQFNANMFAQCAGLTKINVVGISCETGYLDVYGNQNGKSVANISLGEAGMANVTKTGGFIASINNSRYGWVNWETDQLFGNNQSWRLHYWMYDGTVQGMNAGTAWRRMAQNYYTDFGYTHLPELIPGQCYTQMMLFGDPLIAAVTPENASISGDTWNVGTVDGATITTSASKTITIPSKTDGAPYGAMSLTISQPANATLTLAGDGGLKVMRGITVSGGKLEIGINGGQGGVGTYATDNRGAPLEAENAKRPNGLKFTSTGELTFNNTREDAYYFVNKVQNASKITFAGAGAIINTDDFDSKLQKGSLVFQGPNDFDPRTAPANVIRANLTKKVGALTRFMPLTLNNSALTLETHDTFNGYAGETFMTLNNSILKYRENRWRGLTDQEYFERVRGKLNLNNSTLAVDYPCNVYLTEPTLEVTGNSSIEATHGGAFKLEGVTTIVLKNNATLTLDAKFEVLQGGGLTITGFGRVVVANATGLAGNVQIGEGITLELAKLPLADVTVLTLANNVRLVLPDEGTFYQVLPLSSALYTGEGVTVALKDDDGVERVINAEITQTGSIFESGSILAWTTVNGDWDGSVQYFPDVKVNNRVEKYAFVDVAEELDIPFACFANVGTEYTFRLKSEDSRATITFDSLSIGGKTSFLLPTYYKTRLYIAGGDFYGSEVVSPVIEVAAGGRLEAGEISSMNGEPAEVRVLKDGTFVLAGQHVANFTFEAGARLKAENGKHLTYEGSSFIWPESGKVVVDVGDWEATDELTPIIIGINADMKLLRHLEASDSKVTLAINERGDVCLVRCDTEDDDWLKDGVIDLTSESTTITFDTPKHYATLTFNAKIENAQLTLNITEGGSLMTDELHFEGIAKVEVSNVKLGTGTLYAANETHVKGESFGALAMTANDTVYLYAPTEPWILEDGVQGAIFVGITDRVRAERQKIFKINPESDWPIAGLNVEPYDFANNVARDDFSFVREGEWVYLVPPGIKGTVSVAGETKWSEISWVAYDGESIDISDWSNVYAVEIVSANDAAVVVMDGAPRQDLVTSGKKLTLKADAEQVIELPSEVLFNNELTIEGPILPTLDYVKGAGKLILNTGSVTEIVIPGSIMPIEAPIEIKTGSTLRLAHETYFQNKSADFRYLSGEGTLEIRDVSAKGARFFMPPNELMCPSTLTFKLETELELQHVHCSNPLVVGNLTGSGRWGYGLMDPNTMLVEMGYFMATHTNLGFDQWRNENCGTRVLKTVQSDVSEWTGWFPDWYGMTGFEIIFDAKLVVAGSELTPDFSRRLIFSGTANDNASITCTGDKGADHTVTIEPTGCFELNGYWNGTIENKGVLVLGRRCLIKSGKTKFSGSGKIAALGTQIDLTAYSAFKNYTLAAGTYGEIVFAASESLANEQVVMKADQYAPQSGEELILIAINGNERQWQKVSADNFKNGNLVWLPEGGQATESEIVFTLKAGSENNFAELLGDKYIGATEALTIRGAEDGTSYLDATEAIGSFKGVLNLDKATVKCISPLETKLGANPVGKLVFVVDNLDRELELMNLAEGFTYDPTKFTVEIVDKDGNVSDEYWTWTAQNGVLKYVLTNPKTNAYMPRAYKFDESLASWGTNTANLGTPTADKFVPSRDGYAITNHNPYGSGFEIGGNDWTVMWSARLSPTANAIHFALGTTAAGGFTLTSVDDSHAAISRWLGGKSASRLITAEVPFATTRFNHYALTYRKGRYTLYVNGVKAGEANDLEGAGAYPDKINWQFFSVHGGVVGNTTTPADGALDDWRLYSVALGEKMIQAVASEFAPWPDFTNPQGGEIELDVDSVNGQVYLEGSGTVILTRPKGGSGLAAFKYLSGDAKIVIENGVELVVEMSANNRTPLSAHQVEIKKGGRLVLKQTSDMIADYQNLSGVDLSNIQGNGTLEFRSDNLQYKLKLPTSRKSSSALVVQRYWGENLSICINTQIQLHNGYTETLPLVLRNLSGNGSFYSKVGGELGYVEIIQTEHTVFTGSFPKEARVKVVGEGNAPNPEAALVFNPTSALPTGMTITTAENGVIGFSNTANVKNPTITNNGLVVFEPAWNETANLMDINFKLDFDNWRKIALRNEGTLYVPVMAYGFTLQANPVGTLRITGDVDPDPKNVPIIDVADDFRFDSHKFRVVLDVNDRAAAPSVDDGWLKVKLLRFHPPRIIIR